MKTKLSLITLLFPNHYVLGIWLRRAPLRSGSSLRSSTFFLFLVSFFLFLDATAQVPQGFNYQAIARNSSGEPIANTTLQVKIGILSDTITPVIVREELHSTVKTNAYGIFSLVVGAGTWI
jgi:hypothetical protein